MTIELVVLLVVFAVVMFVVFHHVLQRRWHESFVRPQLERRAQNTRNIDLIPESKDGNWIRLGRQSPFSSSPDNSPDWTEKFGIFDWSLPCSVVVAVLILLVFGAVYLLVR